MRWKSSKVGDVNHWHVSGCLEFVTRFLFLPKTIAGETRWLEHATWERKRIYATHHRKNIWIDIRWID